MRVVGWLQTHGTLFPYRKEPAMAKYLTIRMKFDDDVDVVSDSVQNGMVQAIETFEAVLEAEVVQVAEVPDVADGEGRMEPSGESPLN
jgi:hypothetical protein